MENMKDEEIKLLSPYEAIYKFSSQLTTKVRELDQMEREYKLMPNQSTEILQQMIEAQLYTIFKTMIASNSAKPEDKEAAFKAMAFLTKANPTYNYKRK